jgi:N-acetylglucosaminyldiphosphoundecaprenol N-acetyl-beta-D-mannosaminyltransferase
VQWADIGDLILTTPALDVLREAHPSAHIALLTSPHAAPIVDGTGLVDAVYTLPRHAKPPAMLRLFWRLRAEKFDAVIFFHHLSTRAGAWKYAALAHLSGAPRRIGLDNGRGGFLTDRVADDGFEIHHADHWLRLVEKLGADPSPRPCRVASEPFDLGIADQPYLVVHPGSGGYSLARRWDVEKLAAAADRLAEQHGLRVVVVGSKNDDGPALRAALRTPAPINLVGETSLPQLADVLAYAALYLGSDSGVSHLAGAVGAPSVVVFGPTNPNAWRPWNRESRSVVVRAGVECSPCSYYADTLGDPGGCAARTCMKLVTVEQVVRAADEVLRPAADIATAPIPKPQTVEPVEILGLPVHPVTYPLLLDQIGRWVAARDRAHHICTINPEFVMSAQSDAIFKAILLRSDLNVPDGVGLLWAAKRLGRPLPARVTGSDGVPIIAERAAREGWRLFFLGAADGVAQAAADILTARYPGLQMAGVYSGSPRAEDEDGIVERINASGADVLFVAYGAPGQDKWIARNLPRLRVAMAMGVGGSFDFIAGIVPRAPSWMQRAGLEWLFRLIRQPWRAKRMLRLPLFVLAVLRSGKHHSAGV